MDALNVLKSRFGFERFRGQQAAIIDHVLSGKHALTIMPTGGGKSLCYQVPALVHRSQAAVGARGTSGDGKQPLTLVLSPLVALMKDQVDALSKRRISAAYVNSLLGRREREQAYARIAEGRFDLLYVTPERFRKPEFLNVISQREIRLLAVDEAHCISEWGHDFRPDYTRLREFREMLGNPVTLALTATATPDVQRDIVDQLGLQPDDVRLFHEGIDRPNLTLSVEQVWGTDEKVDHILQAIERNRSSSGRGIVYFTLIRVLEEFSAILSKRGVKHLRYHGQLERDERRRTQNRFMNEDGSLVLATNAFGMGIDREDIRFVLHAEIPGSMESWYQEIGRSGRDGLPAECVLLYDESDLNTQIEFLRWSNPDAEFYERVFDLLAHDSEQIHAFGLEWLRERLHARQKHDRRLETALQMLDRYGTVEGTVDPMTLTVTGPLPEELHDQERLQSKLLRDQQKLYALVQFIHHDGDRKAFIHEYFGLPYAPGNALAD